MNSPHPVRIGPASRLRVSAAAWICGLIFSVLLNVAVAADALPFISPLFSENMVLQRGQPNKVWGWTHPGESVRVTVAGKSVQAVAAADGRWTATFDPPAVGGPYTVKIEGKETVEWKNILVGDVWVCGGQSNMQFALAEATNGADEVKAADHPQIRFFVAKPRVGYAPATIPIGTWRVCSPDTVNSGGAPLSAVGYFFARKVQAETGVPIGLLEVCLGGSTAESWMDPDTLRRIGGFGAKLDGIAELHREGSPEYGSFLMHWLDRYDVGQKEAWNAEALDDSTWTSTELGSAFQALGLSDAPGVCWFRKTITLPDPLPAGDARVYLGSVDKMESTYVNGQQVGVSSWVENPRNYPLKHGLLKPGKNVVAVRVFKNAVSRGFWSPQDAALRFADGTSVPLTGTWKAKLSVNARPPHPLPLDVENYPTMPAVLYLGAVRPLAGASITGFLWYQGEANSSRAFQYRQLLPGLISDWRNNFDSPNAPFYIASLPAFMHRKPQPGDDDWAELREAQALTARTVPNCGLAVTIDTGDADNIHPKDKLPVGERLARLALKRNYGKSVVDQGPTFTTLEKLPGALRLHFSHTDGGLIAHGGRAAEFSVAGEDRKWHWAEARIENDAVVVSSPEVSQPVAARYAWQANPEATLFNGAGLPATPFRTDDWPLKTEAASAAEKSSSK